MPASLSGDSAANNAANPSLGPITLFDLLSGPKGSPFDVRRISAWGATTGTPTYVNDAANQKPSTGALSTGIGYGCPPIMGTAVTVPAAAAITAAGFSDNYIPGATKIDKTTGIQPATDSTYAYIGGGKSGPISTVTYGIPFPTAPYTAGYGIGGAGAGGSRDAGAGPAFTGFQIKTVTAAGAVAQGAVVEAGWVYRGDKGGSVLPVFPAPNPTPALVAGQHVFGSSTTASAAVV